MRMTASLRHMMVALLALIALPFAAAAQAQAPAPRAGQQPDTFSPEEIVDSGHRFFGTVSRGLALTVQEAF